MVGTRMMTDDDGIPTTYVVDLYIIGYNWIISTMCMVHFIISTTCMVHFIISTTCVVGLLISTTCVVDCPRTLIFLLLAYVFKV